MPGEAIRAREADLASGSHYNLNADIHRLTYGLPTHYEGLAQTTTERGRLVQVRVLDTDNAHLASVHLWADNLYVAGFYAPGSNVHFVFNDRVQEFQNTLGITNARIMPRTGNYAGLPGGNNRAELVLNPQRMYHGMQQLHSPTDYSDNVGSGLLTAVQIFSEASRFSPILDRVRKQHCTLGEHPSGWGLRRSGEQLGRHLAVRVQHPEQPGRVDQRAGPCGDEPRGAGAHARLRGTQRIPGQALT
ncbi:ribosome-inactivating family protein [Streptomyces sp. H27-H5]|uniref:ribosome-inactivating family protein n=1 Tax=Streptomyces sp. H27-H5 TaxID=2996460 RepID=UPI00226FB2AF|nr:ribosome-inactivating family protein [Streptomyces sp. H27-H5]MCY0961005.1 hypothetical protein [Streptomyces sp. H27-H5]